jgi:hypothetical protein
MVKKGLSPEEFNQYINKKVDDDKIELFYRANLINPLKIELFKDFIISLIELVHSSYPGDDVYYDDYYLNHCKFCFDKVTANFGKEDLYFDGDSKEIFDYCYLTLEESYYNEKKDKNNMTKSLKILYEKIFDMENMNKTQSDLEILL